MDCLFCKIIAKEIPAHIVYENSRSLAFLDIHPHAKGHSIVVPMVHAETFLDMNEELLKDFFIGVKKTMERIEETLHPDGFNVGWNEKPAGGQVVPHLHAHILPRWQNDGGGSVHSIVKTPGDMSVEQVATLFRV